MVAVKNKRFELLEIFHEHGVDISPVQNLILENEEKVQADIQTTVLEARKNHSKTPLGRLSHLFKETQENQTNETETETATGISLAVATKSGLKNLEHIIT
ncbi:MAG: hypothetical protein AAB276_03230 [Pseudomonadota bacterium]